MSIYKENKFKELLNKRNLFILGGIIILIIIIYLISIINFSSMFKKDNLTINFDNNPLILSEKENTLINVTIINDTEKDQENLRVSLKNVEDTFTIFCPDSEDNKVTITKVAKGNQRTITCNVRYDRSKEFFEGTYSFDVNYYVDDLIFEKRANLLVKR